MLMTLFSYLTGKLFVKFITRLLFCAYSTVFTSWSGIVPFCKSRSFSTCVLSQNFLMFCNTRTKNPRQTNQNKKLQKIIF